MEGVDKLYKNESGIFCYHRKFLYFDWQLILAFLLHLYQGLTFACYGKFLIGDITLKDELFNIPLTPQNFHIYTRCLFSNPYTAFFNQPARIKGACPCKLPP